MINREIYAKLRRDFAEFMKCYPLTASDLDDEEWRNIAGYNDKYQVSNYGRVKSFCDKTPRILKPALGRYNYPVCSLRKSKKTIDRALHRLVAETFIPNLDNKPQVNHIDGNRLNNCVSNLEWCTQEENMRHAVKTGLHKSGENNYLAKLTNEQALYVRENPDNLTLERLAKMFSTSIQAISYIQTGKSYKNAGGKIRQPQKRPPNVTNETKSAIRAEYVYGSKEFGCYALAKKYGYAHSTIWQIVNEK